MYRTRKSVVKRGIVCAAMLLLLTSCASTKYEGTAACVGRVCGLHGEPVENYQVSFGLGHSAVTGKNGMFLIPEIRAGTYTLKGKGTGWTSVEKEVSFIDRRSIVCVQVEPISAVYQRVESLLRSGLFDEADSLLKKEKVSNAESKLYQFYQQVIDYCRSPSDRKMRKISEKVMEETKYEL